MRRCSPQSCAAMRSICRSGSICRASRSIHAATSLLRARSCEGDSISTIARIDSMIAACRSLKYCSISEGVIRGSTDRTNHRRGEDLIQRCAEAIPREGELALGNIERAPFVSLGRHLETYQIGTKNVCGIQCKTFPLPIAVLAEPERRGH